MGTVQYDTVQVPYLDSSVFCVCVPVCRNTEVEKNPFLRAEEIEGQVSTPRRVTSKLGTVVY